MLFYEHEGFIEVDAKEVQQLCRSTFAISFGSPDQNKYELQASICDYRDQDEQRCRIAFYDKTLKKALVFSVAGKEKTAVWQYGRQTLLDLGYQLEDVNLKLSPAMLEVVLRDVPGIASPAEAQLIRTEHQKLLADLQATFDEKPESPQGKKAGLKLSSEKRLQERSVKLKELLEDLFSPEEETTDEEEALLDQIKDLTARLEESERLAESERSQKEVSEAITSAAEKRIQELEEILVDVETQSSDVLKQKRKVATLNGRIKELEAELDSARNALAEEQKKQELFVDDVKSVNEQINVLQKELKDSQALREEALTQLAKQKSETTQLEKSCREAELRNKVLDQELKAAQNKAAGLNDADKLAEDLRAQLDKAEEQLNETSALSDSLKDELAIAVEKQESLQKSLQEAEKLAKAAAAENKELQALEDRCVALGQENETLKKELSSTQEKHHELEKRLEEEKSSKQGSKTAQIELQEMDERHTELVKTIEGLREELELERSVRKRLERGASEDDRRISELEQSLEQVEGALEELRSCTGDADPSAVLEQEMKALTLRFEEEKTAREALDGELGEAHKMIDSLEKMVRETEGAHLEKTSAAQDDVRVQELEEQVRTLEEQLEKETLVKKTLAKELASAEKRLAGLEDSSAGSSTTKKRMAEVEAAVPGESERTVKASRPLPHELRPAPKKGAFFRPDWDLQGLPCRSTGEIIKAWETVFNVQIAIEGYPSQYCMAFMAILQQGKQKKLFLLYRLKQNKHTLVCLPAKRPKDNAGLQKAVKEGLDFLRKSGFEMDEMSRVHIESTLGAYCLDAD